MSTAVVNNPTCTNAELRAWLDYDPRIGIFFATRSRKQVKAGQAVGWTDDKGYIRFFLNKELHLAHRTAWFWVHGVWPSSEIDHDNGLRSDNRIDNLREATSEQNGFSKNTCRSASGFKGVTLYKKRKWQAQIGVNRKNVHIGYFKAPELAAAAYDSEAIRYFGEFAKTNKSLGLLP